MAFNKKMHPWKGDFQVFVFIKSIQIRDVVGGIHDCHGLLNDFISPVSLIKQCLKDISPIPTINPPPRKNIKYIRPGSSEYVKFLAFGRFFQVKRHKFFTLGRSRYI